MNYIKTVKRPGVARFLADEDITSDEFKSLMIELASALSSKVEWIAMPEAEIAKIKSSSGEIYAKLDFEYRLEFDCNGFTDHEILQIETALSEK